MATFSWIVSCPIGAPGMRRCVITVPSLSDLRFVTSACNGGNSSEKRKATGAPISLAIAPEKLSAATVIDLLARLRASVAAFSQSIPFAARERSMRCLAEFGLRLPASASPETAATAVDP